MYDYICLLWYLSILAFLREELCLVVNQSKQGFNNTNDTNTTRRAIDNAKSFARRTGTDENIIVHLRTILNAVCMELKWTLNS